MTTYRVQVKQAGDLGDRKRVVGGFEGAGEKRLLPDRLIGKLRVDAR